MEAEVAVRLTQYSHGAGCGCKIAPRVLDEILSTNKAYPGDARILVGNDARDDAAVYDLGNGQGLVSTTDFFMPIVDDPYTFGRIAAANAISDVYAMGGTPVLAIAILGWPVGKLPPEIARAVVEGGRDTCRAAGIALAGGHSIDNPEPIFGLAVNGLVQLEHLKPNNAAQAGDLLFLTKPLGVGILSTAQKRGICTPEDARLAAGQMMALNKVGADLARIPGVHAMTDVTGFGLLGHLLELCEGSGVSAELDFARLPLVTDLNFYLEAGAVPGGTQRNWESYGSLVGLLSERQRAILADPQTSGGLLVAVAPESVSAVSDTLSGTGLEQFAAPIGRLLPVTNDFLINLQ